MTNRMMKTASKQHWEHGNRGKRGAQLLLACDHQVGLWRTDEQQILGLYLEPDVPPGMTV